MSGLTCDLVKQTKRERDRTIQHAITSARKIELNMLHQYAGQGLFGELRNACRNLLRIAQRYVPTNPSAFSDAAEVVKCAKVLHGLDLQPELEARFTAAVQAEPDKSALNSFEYRYLRNKAIAGFATIADLTFKPAAVGSVEYQNGVREGYRRASEIAIMFLEDVQQGKA